MIFNLIKCKKDKILLSLFVLLAIILISYYKIYSLKNNSDVQKYLIKNYHANKTIKIINSLEIEDLKICLIDDKENKNHNYVQTVALKKGLNKRFKVKYLSKRSNNNILLFEEKNGKTYVICIGYNDKNFKNKTIGLEINNQKLYLKFNIKNKKSFMEYKKCNFCKSKNHIKLIDFEFE